MNRDTQSVLLVLVGGALVRITVDDTFLRYVKDWMRPGLLAAGVVVIALGVVSLWRERRFRHPGAGERGAGAHIDGEHSDGDHGAGEHGHDPAHGPWVAWLLVLPVLAIFLVAPPALGSYTATRTVATVAEPAGSGFEPLAAGDPVTISLTDYATRTIWDRGRSLAGRRIRMVGFVSPRPDGGFYLSRIAMSCCAADARPIRITVADAPRTFPADTWVAVTGAYGGLDPAAGTNEQVPLVRAESVEPVRAPADPYET